MMKLSVVIPCYNESATIQEIVREVKNAPVKALEIIIVDDASNDGSKEIIREQIEPTVDKVIYHQKNMGKGAALRSGIKEATGDIVVVQDADLEPWYGEYDHPLWKTVGDKARGAGHGGMDYLEDYRLVQAILKGEPTDMDVYDAAAWSAICEATEKSVVNKSRPVAIPDFTRGMWKTREPLGIVV